MLRFCFLFSVLFLANLCVLGRELEQLDIQWDEEDGFSLLSDLVDITVNDANVSVDSSIGKLHVEDGDVVIDSQLLKLDTRQDIIVEVANGNVLQLTSPKTGAVELSIGPYKEEDIAKIHIQPRDEATEKGEAILVHFSEDGGTVTVAVGSGGRIVDVETPEGYATVSEDQSIAKMNLISKEADVEITTEDKEWIEDQRGDDSVNSVVDGVSVIQVTGSDIIDSSSETSLL